MRLWESARWAREAVRVAPAEVPQMMKPDCGVVEGGRGDEGGEERECVARVRRVSQASWKEVG